MNQEEKDLRQKVYELAEQLEKAQSQLSNVAPNCQHQYGPVIYDPICHEGFMHAGDPQGTMGVDRIPQGYVPEMTVDRWKRQCQLCGKVEYTKDFQEKVKRIPKF